jgi:hypothetical protein
MRFDGRFRHSKLIRNHFVGPSGQQEVERVPLLGGERCEALPKAVRRGRCRAPALTKDRAVGLGAAGESQHKLLAQSRNWLVCRLKDALSQLEASLSAFVRRKVAIAHSSSEAIARRCRSAITERVPRCLFSIAFAEASTALFSEAN